MIPASRSTVYIPLAELTHKNDQLLEVYAQDQGGITDSDKKAFEKQLNLVAAPLKDAYLYEPGVTAVSAVRKLKYKTPRWALYQRLNKNYPWISQQRLNYSGKSLESEGDSAQLGLAIALLLNASDSPIQHAIATGSLNNEKPLDYDVAVGAVGSVPQKLDLIIQKRQANDLQDNKPLYCFTPVHYKDQQTGELKPVAELPQVNTLAALNITVKPIKSLGEAQAILNAHKTRCLVQDKLLGGLTGLGLAALLIGLGYWSWLAQPIPLHMLPGKRLAQPFLVCTSSDNQSVQYHDLDNDGGIPVFPVLAEANPDYNVSLGFKLKAGKTLFSNQYHVALLHLGQRTGLKVVTKTIKGGEAITIPADGMLAWNWIMEEGGKAQEQDNALLIKVQRQAFNAAELDKKFNERFPNLATHKKAQALDIVQASNWLSQTGGSQYTFFYKSVKRGSPCTR